MKLFSILLTSAVASALSSVHAATTVQDFAFVVNTGIPDGSPSGLVDVQTLTTPITEIESVTLSLNISGGFNGDIYAYLQHGSGFAVLLNRVGRTSSNPFGTADTGFDITLDDSGLFPDIHTQTSGGSLLTGTFASDGRNIDPDLVLDTDPRTADLDSFAGLDANGDWVLFVADVSGGESHTLNSWSIEVKGVPEPDALPLLFLSLLLFVKRRR